MVSELTLSGRPATPDSFTTFSLGIDLGTSYTAAAVCFRAGIAEIVQLGSRHAEMPSVVFALPDGELLFGDAAERRGAADPGRVAREFKRRMGDTVPILLGGVPYHAHDLTSRMVRDLVTRVTELQGGLPDSVTVTHPANYGPYKRDALRQAILRAGVKDAQLRSEPEAAAVWYASTARLKAGETIAVYDLGGGTFDAAVLRKEPDGFTLLGRPEGIDALGGADFDEAVFKHVLSHLDSKVNWRDANDEDTTRALTRLKRDCVDAKEALSFDIDATIAVSFPTHHSLVRITRHELEHMISPRLEAATAALRTALKSAEVDPSELRAILLAGGSCRIPLIAERLRTTFDRPVALDPHPEHSIALGAALMRPPSRSTTSADPTVSSSRTVYHAGDLAHPEPTEPPARLPSDENRHRLRGSRRRVLVVTTLAALVGLLVAATQLIGRRSLPDSVAPSSPIAAWRRLPDLPVELEGAAVAAFAGRIWVAGGLTNDADRHKVATVYEYDPTVNAWHLGPNLPQPISHAALVGTSAGLYFIGGWIQTGGSRDVLRLDDDLGGWTPRAPLPSPRVSLAAAWDGTRLLVAGGTRPGGAAADEVWAYSDANWKAIGRLKQGRQKLSAIGDGKDTAWFLGGTDEQAGVTYGTIDRFSQGRPVPWSTVIAPGRMGAAAVQINDVGLCLLGGQVGTDKFADWWCANAGAASRLPRLEPPRAGLGAATIGKTIYVVGGYGQDFQGTSRFEALTPTP